MSSVWDVLHLLQFPVVVKYMDWTWFLRETLAACSAHLSEKETHEVKRAACSETEQEQDADLDKARKDVLMHSLFLSGIHNSHIFSYYTLTKLHRSVWSWRKFQTDNHCCRSAPKLGFMTEWTDGIFSSVKTQEKASERYSLGGGWGGESS